MRLSIIALASFIVCAVFASPIMSGRGSDGLSLSRRGPPNTPAKTTKAAPKTTKEEPKKTTGKSCPIKKIHKRADQEVVDAVDEAIKQAGTGGRSGRGAGRGKGKVFPLTFKSQSAMIKIVSSDASEADVKKEVKNLFGVDQYLAWAVKETDRKKQYFIIMKNMGKTQEEWIKEDSHNKAAEFVALRQSTVDRYKSEFKATNPDANVQTGNNFVFHKKDDNWVGEIIDWEIGTVEGANTLPAVETIAESC